MHRTPVFAIASLCAVSTLAVPVTWVNGHTYDLIGNYLDTSQRWTWAESKAMAEALGGHLATITSAEENQFLIDTFHTAAPWPTWIGFTDETVEGDWRWITGEAVTFNGWVEGRPDDTNNEDAAVMGSSWGFDHLWNDVNTSDHAAFFIEWEPVPVPDSTPFAMTIAIAALVFSHKIQGKHRTGWENPT